MAISVENRKFFLPTCILRPPLKGLTLELGIGAGDKKTRVMGLPGGEKKFDDIFSHVD